MIAQALPKKLTFKITAKHISEGEKENACFCPAAISIKGCLGQSYRVFVYLEHVYVYSSHGVSMIFPNCYKITRKLRNFIDRFDQGQYVKPDKFALLIDVIDVDEFSGVD